MIKQAFFNHGWFYLYRIHLKNLKIIPKDHENLKIYLNGLLENCPNQYFKIGPRSSQIKIVLKNIRIHKIKDHEICDLAKQALKSEIKNSPHSKIQNYFLQHDKKTLAVEIPIWLKSNEFKNFREIFKSDDPLTGHIDLIRHENGKIWVWDYKPNAEKEKFAPIQVCLYTLMLSERTKIPIENFKCGYFDNENAFVFNPQNIDFLQGSLK